MRHLEQICQDSGRLQCLESVLHDIGVLGDDADEVKCVRFGEEREVGGGDFLSAESCLTGDGAETGMCVLEVWTGVAFEGGHDIDVESVIVDSVKRY